MWLIGAPDSNLNQTNKLPLLQETLSVFFYHNKELNIVLKESAEVTVQQVLDIWEKVGIPTAHWYDIVKRVLKIHNE